MLQKLVLVTDPFDYSKRIYSPVNFGIIQKPTILNFSGYNYSYLRLI